MSEQSMSASRTVAEAVTMGPRSGPMGFGMGPVFAAGVAAALLIPGLTFGAVATANTLAGQDEGSGEPGSAVVGDDDEQQDDDSAQDSEPGSDPDSDPDRGSDPGEDADQQDSTDTPDDADSDAQESTDDDEDYITEDVVHTVVEGDTLSSISGHYGVPMDIIAEHNGIEDYNLIYIDAAILIPYSEVNVPVGWDD